MHSPARPLPHSNTISQGRQEAARRERPSRSRARARESSRHRDARDKAPRDCLQTQARKTTAPQTVASKTASRHDHHLGGLSTSQSLRASRLVHEHCRQLAGPVNHFNARSAHTISGRDETQRSREREREKRHTRPAPTQPGTSQAGTNTTTTTTTIFQPDAPLPSQSIPPNGTALAYAAKPAGILSRFAVVAHHPLCSSSLFSCFSPSRPSLQVCARFTEVCTTSLRKPCATAWRGAWQDAVVPFLGFLLSGDGRWSFADVAGLACEGLAWLHVFQLFEGWVGRFGVGRCGKGKSIIFFGLFLSF